METQGIRDEELLLFNEINKMQKLLVQIIPCTHYDKILNLKIKRLISSFNYYHIYSKCL